MKESQESFFYGGIDTDSTERAIAQGDYRTALYARSGNASEGEDGALVSMTGNLLYENVDLPAGTNTVIGSCNWVEANSIIFFVHNSNDDHSIFQYDTTDNSFTLVLTDALLNLQIANKIVGARVVNGILYWTDGYFESYLKNVDGIWQFNPPRNLNIQAAIDGTYTTTEQLLDFIKYPSYTSNDLLEFDSSGDSNKLYGSLYQFSVQWVYQENQESTWSPISKLIVPQEWEFISGRNYLDPNADNVLNLSVPTGSELVKTIRVAVRNLNNGQFGIFTELDKTILGIANDTTYPVVFDGNNAIKPLGLMETLRGYDRVPQVADDLEKLPTNQIAFGNFVEGYDPIEISIVAERVLEEIRGTTIMTPRVAYQWLGGIGDTFDIVNQSSLLAGAVFPYQEGDVCVFSFKNNPTISGGLTETFTYIVTQADMAAVSGLSITLATQYIIETIGDALAAYLITQGYTVTTNLVTSPIKMELDISPALVVQPLTSMGSLYPTRPKKSLKKGARHEFGIQYYDRGLRSGGVLTNSDMNLEVPFPSQENFTTFADTHSPYTVHPRIQISNTPPEWAEYYQIMTRRVTNIRDFQYRTVTDLATDPSSPNLYKLSLDNYYETAYGATINHQIQVGDIVRVVTDSASFVQSLPAYANGYVELEVLKYDASGGVGGQEAVWVRLYDYQTINRETTGFLVEIYTPNLQTIEAPWFEIGEIKRMLNASTDERVHEGQDYFIKIVTQAGIGNNVWVVDGNLDYLGVFTYALIFTPLVGLPLITVATTAVYDPATNTTTITTEDNATLASYLSMSFSTDQTDTTKALLNLDFGDVYVRPRLSQRVNTNLTVDSIWRFYVEDPSVSDYYLSQASDYGRIGIQNANFKRTQLKASVLHGGSFIDNTTQNNICSFDFDVLNKADLDEQFGQITRIIINGYTLKVLQERKETSIYIQRTLAVGADGQNQLSYSPRNQTFGGVNPYDTLYGTIHKTSVRVVDGQLFYYDFHSGVFIRSLNNGQQYISDAEFKFNKRTLELTQFVQAGAELNSAIDSFNNEYRCYFIQGETAIGAVFNYKDGRWRSEVDYFPEWTENLGFYSVEFLGGELYESNGGDPLDFFGVPRTFSVTNPFNAVPNYMKVPLNLGLRINQAPTVEIDVSAQASYSAMKTTIANTLFKLYENGYWSDVTRDELNVAAGVPYLKTTELARVNGRILRCYSSLQKISVTSSERVILFSIKVNYVPSESAE
jgi:TusA-related sulfurtransferase